MRHINENVVFSVNRIRSTFSNSKVEHGTGFWIATRKDQVFVTNRHCLDFDFKLGSATGVKLERLEIETRQIGDNGSATPQTCYSDFPPESIVYSQSGADCAAIASRNDHADGYRPICIGMSDIASESDFASRIRLMDRVHFVGFAMRRVGSGVDEWWDTAWNIPIAREGSIASLPSIAFSNRIIRSSDTMLISGHSFAGASGSPVLHQGPDGRTAVIGMMSGHLINLNHASEQVHGGLSWLTRSTAIQRLLLALT